MTASGGHMNGNGGHIVVGIGGSGAGGLRGSGGAGVGGSATGGWGGGGGSMGGRGMGGMGAGGMGTDGGVGMGGRGVGGSGVGGRIVDSGRELRHRDQEYGLLGGDGATVQRVHGERELQGRRLHDDDRLHDGVLRDEQLRAQLPPLGQRQRAAAGLRRRLADGGGLPVAPMLRAGS